MSAKGGDVAFINGTITIAAASSSTKIAGLNIAPKESK
jgi:hypothetical protein